MPSAVLLDVPDAESIAINENHINMVKFTSQEDVGYATVSGHLQLLAQAAPHAVDVNWVRQERVDQGMMNT